MIAKSARALHEMAESEDASPASGPSEDLRQLCHEFSASYVDFGCGRGGSMRFADSLMGGAGIGVEKSADKVEHARRAGHQVVHGDVLDLTARGVAVASVSIDLVPELSGPKEFETLITNMIRCARDFALVQHLSFDGAETLFARGLTGAEYADKSIRFRPRIGDYLLVVDRLASKLDISGLGIFGIGTPKTVPSQMPALGGTMLAEMEALPLYRSIRVVIGRKTTRRFEDALRRSATGTPLVTWTRAASE